MFSEADLPAMHLPPRASESLELGREPVAVVVCERSGQWARRLRGLLTGLAVPIRETRCRDECLEQLVRHPAAVVCLDWQRADPQLWTTLARQGELRYPKVLWVALAERGDQPPLALLGELGITYSACTPRALGPVRNLVARQMTRYPGRAESKLPPWAAAAVRPWVDRLDNPTSPHTGDAG